MYLRNRHSQERGQDSSPKHGRKPWGMSGSEDANPLSIYYLIGLVKRKRLTIIAVTLLVGLLSTAIVLMREPQFTSTVLLVLDGGPSEVVNKTSIRALNQIDTEVEMLRALNIVKRLAERLKFANDAKNSGRERSYSAGALYILGSLNEVLKLASLAYQANWPAPVQDITKVVKHVSVGIDSMREPRGASPLAPAEKRSEEKGKSSYSISSDQIMALGRRFRIRRRGLTDVIAIEAKSKTPAHAAMLANLYAEVYLDEQVAAKLYSIERVETALRERIDELKAEMSKPGAGITLRETYNDFLSDLKDVRQRRSVIIPDLRIAAPALPLEVRAFPQNSLLLLLGWMLALGLALVVAFLRDGHFIL